MKLALRLVLSIGVLLPAALNAADYYVATSGNDITGTGALAAPFATIQRAANAAVAGDKVIIRAGTYRETVRPANSGTAGSPITYQAYETGGVYEDVVISGADPLTGWSTHDTSNGRAIYKTTTMGWNLADTGASFGTAYRNQIFVNGQMQVLARWPNVPSERITRLTYQDLALVSAASGQAGSTATSAWIENADLAGTFPANYWTAPARATARVFLSPATMIWGMSVKISSQSANRLNLDATGSGFSFTNSYYYPTTNNRFFIYDYYDALDSAGEYWKDTATNTVYLWAPASANPSSLTVEAKRRDFGLSLGSRSHLTFRGIKLFACTVDSDSASTALTFSEIEARYLAHIDNYAPTFSTPANSRELYLRGDGHVVRDSYFFGSAVTVIGASGTNIRVENNVIRDFGYAHHGPAILSRNGAIYGNRTIATKNQFLRNTAFNGGHTIVVTDPALDVKYNRIYNSHLRGSDIGAIGIASTDGLGSEIAYNVISDAAGPRDSGVLYGGFGIYFDYECRNYTVHHNIVWGTTGGSYQLMPNRAAYLSGVTNMGMKFYHNTGDGDFGLIEPQDVTGVDVRNNLVRKFLNASSGTYANNLPNIQFANNTAYATDAAAPFRDRANHDLRFATGSSTGVNAGTVISPFSDGFTGASPDTGALEFDLAPFIAGATLTQRQLSALTVTSIAQSGNLVDLQLSNLPEGRSPPTGFQAQIGGGAFGGTLAYDNASSTWRILGVSKGVLTGPQTVGVRLSPESPAVVLATSINAANQTLTTYRSIPMDCGGWFSGFAIHSSGRLYGFGDVFGMWRSNDAGQSWQYLQGDFTDNDTFINGCAVSAGNVDTVAFLSASKLFKSTDGGATWGNLLTGLTPRRDRGATPLIFHPGNGSELWLASARTGYAGTLWRSNDGGATWVKVGGSTFDTATATTIYVRPELPDQIWVGAVGGLYVSADHGASWTQVWSNAGGIAPLDASPPTVTAIARRADGVGYIATNTQGWRITATDYTNPATYTANATVAWWSGWGPNNATVLADGSFLTNTAGDNLSRSTDGGLTWTPLAMQLLTPPTPAWTLAANNSTKAAGVREMIVQDPTNPARWFMTGGKAPFITTDSGATWKYPPVLNGLAGIPTYKVRFPRSNSSTALIPSSDMGGFTVTDAGFSGNVANSLRTSVDLHQTYHEILSSDDGQALVAAGTDQVNNASIITRSINGGVTWTKLDLAAAGLPLSNEGITRAVAAPGNINDFLVLLGSDASKANNNPGLYRTTNGGISFTQVSGIPAGLNTGMRYHHENSWLETDGVNLNTRYLSLRSDTDATARGFWRSTDGGSTWAKTPGQPFGTDWILCMAVDRATAGRVWVAGGYRGVKRSDDGGDTWTSVSGFTDSISIDAANNRIAVWGKRSGDTWFKIYYSDDNGLTWTEKTGPGQRYANLSALAVDPYRAGQIWVSGISVNVINPPASIPFIILPGQSPSGQVGQAFTYTLQASGSPTAWTLVSGSLPPGVTLDTATGILSGSPTGSGSYSATLAATNGSGTTPAVTMSLVIQPALTSYIYEPFAYTNGANNPDPDAGLNSGNGLPSINVGGIPTGTSTGLRGTWGITTDVVAGLSYTQGSKNLVTSGGAGRVNNATWGGNPYIYRFMTVDPFLAQRIGASNNGSFGVDGSSLFVSFLASTSSATADAFRFSFRYDGAANFYVSNTATGWNLNGTTATNAPLALNTPTLIVLRFDFAAGATDSVSMWVNPALGAALGTANATVSALNFPGLNNFTTRPSVANAMTLDELRIGASYDLVTPWFVLAPTAPAGLAATPDSASQITLNWADNSGDETGFKIERSPDGLTSWTLIATPAANATSYANTGLTYATAYYYRVRATNSGGDSAWSATASATTAKLDQVITFASLPANTYGDASFSLTATSDSGLAVSYASSNPAVAIVSGNTVTIVGAGSTTLTASQPGDASYNAATSATQTLTVSKASQNITFAALPAKTYGDASFTLDATASSGLAVSYTSSNPAVATVSGNTVTIVGVGSTTLTAGQAGDANYNAATSATQTLTVAKASQSITFAALPEKADAAPNFTLTATSSSGLPVSYASSNPAVASVSGNTVTIVGVGSTTLTASQPGNANFNAATDVAQTQTVVAGVLIIAEPFAYTLATNNPDPDAGLNGGNGLPATNVGGNPSGTSTGLRSTWGTTTDVVAGLNYSMSGKQLVTSGGAGRVNNATWGGQPYVYRSMTTDPFLAQRIAANANFGVDGTSLFVSFLASTSSATDAAFNLSFKFDGVANFFFGNTATGWKMTSQSGATATAPGVPALNTPTLIVLRFDFAAGATDNVSMWVNPALGATLGAPNATISGIDFPGLQNLQTKSTVANAMTLDELRIGTSYASVTPYTLAVAAPTAPAGLTATADSASQITLTWTDNSSDETGFKIERSADGSTAWTQLANPAANTISYADTALSAATAYYYRVNATNTGGDSAWSATASATTSKLSQTITFAALAAKTYGDASFTLGATASSGLAVSYASSNPAVATVSGNTVTIVGAGSTTITASQVGDATYNAAIAVTQTLSVAAVTVATPTFTPTAGSYTSAQSVVLSSTTGGASIRYTTDGSTPTSTMGTVYSGALTLSVTTTVKALAYAAGMTDSNVGTATFTISVPSNTVTAQGDYAAVGEGIDKLTDGNLSTKWLDFSATSWVRFSYGLPTVWNSYAITSGNDAPERDPKNWTLSGSNDGTTWTLLDTRTNQTWATRAQTNNYTFTNTTAYSFYKWDITANGSGSIIQAAEFTFSNQPAPAAPAGLTATADSASQITLTWTDNSSDETGFKIERSADGSTAWTQIANPAANTINYADTALSAATTYYYRVRATNAGGDSSWSATASATTSATPSKLSQTITFAALAAKQAGDAAFNLTATSSSGLSVGYVSSNPSVATVTGSTVSIVGVGITTITASQPGNATYDPATSVAQTLTVTAVATDLTTELPPLSGANVGTGSSGSATVLTDGAWWIDGSGSGLASTADSVHFENISVLGDAQILVCVKSLTSSGTAPRAGLMLRESNAPGARYVMVAIPTGATGSYRYGSRTTTNSAASETMAAGAGATFATPPAWMMLQRTGDTVTIASSTTSAGPFDTLGTVTLANLGATLQAGVFSTSGSVGVNSRAIMSGFEFIKLDVDTGLSSRWKLDNNLLATPTTYNGTAVGTISYVTGKLGTHALSLNGTNTNYATTPFVINPQTGDFTATAWVKLTTASAAQFILHQTGTTGRAWLYRNSTGKLCTLLGNVATVSTTTLNVGVWYHVAVVKKGATGTNIQLYVNGVADGAATARTVESATSGLRLGAHKTPSTSNKNWNGQIDDIRLYNRALLPSEIQTIAIWSE